MSYQLEFYDGHITTSYCQIKKYVDKPLIKQIIHQDDATEIDILFLFPNAFITDVSRVSFCFVICLFDKYWERLSKSRLLKSPLIKQITIVSYNFYLNGYEKQMHLWLNMMSDNPSIQRLLYTLTWDGVKTRQQIYSYGKDMILQAINNNQLVLNDRLTIIVVKEYSWYIYYLILSLAHNHTVRQITIYFDYLADIFLEIESYELKLFKIYNLLLSLLRINDHLADIRLIYNKNNFSISDISRSIKQNSLALTAQLINRNENKRKKSLSFTETVSKHLTF